MTLHPAFCSLEPFNSALDPPKILKEKVKRSQSIYHNYIIIASKIA